jgi:hypothetical protein
MDWKDNLEVGLKSHLEFQLKEVNKEVNNFKKAKDPSKAQLWVAIANLSKLVSALNMKITALEGTKVKKKVQKKQKTSKK